MIEVRVAPLVVTPLIAKFDYRPFDIGLTNIISEL
jgi:hypothetical protein